METNQAGDSPTSLVVTFNKLINGERPKGSSHFITILAVDITSTPKAQIVNVDDLLPDMVFTDLEITVQSSDATDIDLSIDVTGD